jgi:hypothetical protein
MNRDAASAQQVVIVIQRRVHNRRRIVVADEQNAPKLYLGISLQYPRRRPRGTLRDQTIQVEGTIGTDSRVGGGYLLVLLLVLLLLATATSEPGRGRLLLKVNNKSRPGLLLVPLKASEVGLVELVIGLLVPGQSGVCAIPW